MAADGGGAAAPGDARLRANIADPLRQTQGEQGGYAGVRGAMARKNELHYSKWRKRLGCLRGSSVVVAKLATQITSSATPITAAVTTANK